MATKNRVGEYERLRDLEWDLKSVKREDTLLEPTKYDLPKRGYDPFRLTALEYGPMESEKDNDLFGMLDGAVRHGAASKIEPRWGEYVKLIATVLPPAEHYAQRTFGQAVRSIPVPELQSGYAFQMQDEMRHFQIEMQAWNRFRIKHGYVDPYGFDRVPSMWGRNVAANIFRAGIENFITNDPVTNLLYLQVFGETAATNALFVAMPDIAAINGDDVYSTCGLTIQSDEARHMANGYATLMSLLDASDRNAELVNEDFLWCAWREFTTLSLPIAFVYENAARRRSFRSAKELWEQYVLDQFYGSYMSKLEKYGISVPDELIEDMHEWITWGPHTLGIFAQFVAPTLWWRQEPLTQEDYDYFEEKYPGWYERYGIIHQLIEETSHRGNGTMAILEGLGVLGKGLQLCYVCQLPTILPHPMIGVEEARRFKMLEDGQIVTFCSRWCERIFDVHPHRFHATFFHPYNKWDLADILRDQGLVRPDGTLVGQPRLDTLGTDQMWTIDDVAKLGIGFDVMLTPDELGEVPHAYQSRYQKEPAVTV